MFLYELLSVLPDVKNNPNLLRLALVFIFLLKYRFPAHIYYLVIFCLVNKIPDRCKNQEHGREPLLSVQKFIFRIGHAASLLLIDFQHHRTKKILCIRIGMVCPIVSSSNSFTRSLSQTYGRWYSGILYQSSKIS